MTDTTMGGGRGGVGIRLFVQGGEVVKRTFDQVGDSGKKMWAEIAMGERAANPALRAMSRASGEAQGAVQGLAGRAGSAGNVLGAFGTSGVVAAAGLGALAVAVTQAKEAMRFADEIDDAANKLNIGTTALQQYRYAMTEVGGAVGDADAAIDGFQKKLGEAMAGGRSFKWFEQLGFDEASLRSFATTDEALQAVIQAVSRLGTEAERAAVAEKLGLGPMIPLIREGVEEVDRLKQAASDLGWVMEEDLIQKGADANQQFEVLTYVIGVQLKSAFVELSDEIVDFTRMLADGLSGLNDFLDAYSRMKQINPNLGPVEVAGRVAGYKSGLWNALPWTRGQRNDMQAFDDADAWAAGNADDPAFMRQQMALSNRAAQERAGGTRLTRRAGSGRSGGGNSAARDAERRARDSERALEALSREELNAEREALRARFGPGGPEESRLELAKAMVSLEVQEQDAQRAALRAQLEKAGALDEVAEARLHELWLLQSEAAKNRDAADLAEDAREQAAKRLEAETARDQHAIDLLDIDGQLATSARERMEIARRILILQQALERKLLADSVDKDGKPRTADEQARLDQLSQRQAGELQVFDHESREEMRAQFHSYGREVVDAIESGRIGEHIADEMKSRLIDMALDGLFDFMNPGGGKGGGGGGFWSTAASVVGWLFGPGRAGGGDLWQGVRHPVVETGRPELLMIGGKGQVTSAAETARLLRETFDAAGGAAGGRSGGVGEGGLEVTVRTTRDFEATVRRTSRAEARSAAATAGSHAVRTSLAGAPQAVADRRAYLE